MTQAPRSRLLRPAGRRSAAVATTLAATALVGTVLVGSSADASATVRATHVTIAADPMTVHVGSALVVSGTAKPLRAGVATYLQRYLNGHWRTLAHKTTTAKGSFAYAVHAPGKHGMWILRVVGTAAVSGSKTVTPGVASHTLHVRVVGSSFAVTATTPETVSAGTAVVVTGSVSPRTTGTVRLQVERGSAWADLATGKLTDTSTFSIAADEPVGSYRLRVVKPFSSTVATGTSAAHAVEVRAVTTTGPAGTPHLAVSSPDDALLALAGTRLVFSVVQGQPLPAAKTLTFTNTGSAAATVSGLSIAGADASSYALAAGQPATVTVPAGGSATVSVAFQPTAPTNCPTTAAPGNFSDASRNAALGFTTNDPSMASGSADLAGVISCGLGGTGEPVLSQVLGALGYTDVVTPVGGDPRNLGGTAELPGTDEIASPYFQVANPALPVTLVPLAHYSSGSLTPYHTTGWYAEGAAMPTSSTCSDSCKPLWQFPADPSLTAYNQNQKLLPTIIGVTSFSPPVAFGLFTGDGSAVNFSDDLLNESHNSDGSVAMPIVYVHDERVYPAYGPGHVAIPDTYLVAIDVGTAAESKNNDFQDLVLILRNVVPAG